jgi:hypothetical protein
MQFELVGRSEAPKNKSAFVDIRLTSSTFNVTQSFELTDSLQRSILDWPGNGSMSVTVLAKFRNETQDDAQATIQFNSADVSGLHLVQTSPDYIIGNVQHSDRETVWRPQISHSDSPGQCTVACPRTGESRSGRNVCIECRTKRGTVKICC